MATNEPSSANSGTSELIRTLLYALIIAVAIRTIAYEPFSVPSESMMPTLLVGDYFFVSKFSYGYSRHSIPFSPPLFSGRILEDMPERGDVAVFKTPADDETDFVKRVIGLPGDRIQLIDGILHINGQAVTRERVPDFPYVDADSNSVVYRETMPNGISYLTIDRGRTFQDNTNEIVVEQGHYFMMGDNRDNSRDSRFEGRGEVGQVPAENLVGRAATIFFSVNGSARLWEVWKWPFAIRFSRLADSLRP
jgi:signal peptidase I